MPGIVLKIQHGDVTAVQITPTLSVFMLPSINNFAGGGRGKK